MILNDGLVNDDMQFCFERVFMVGNYEY